MNVIQVQGRCPSCGSRGLFVGDGGWLTCPSLNCGDPTAPSAVLNSSETRDQLWRVAMTACDVVGLRFRQRRVALKRLEKQVTELWDIDAHESCGCTGPDCRTCWPVTGRAA